MSDYESYCTVIETYLNLKVFPNTIFPNISPRFPIFALDTEGGCHILNHQEIILYKDILSQFSLSDQFLKGTFAKRQLPLIYQDLIQKHLSAFYQKLPSLKNLLFAATRKDSNSLQKQFSEERFETAIKYDTLDFFFYFQMTAIRPEKGVIENLRQQGFIPLKKSD